MNVVSHPIQRYAVWFGGSVLASTAEFYEVYQLRLYTHTHAIALQIFWERTGRHLKFLNVNLSA